MSIARIQLSHKKEWLVAALLLGLSGLAQAGDGVIEINQAKALAGGVTPGDTEGFPVTISESGGYRLTGNLIVPDESTTGIDVTADNVTIDLNTFSVLGPTICTSVRPITCGPTGSGLGIAGVFPLENVSVFNGTVQGMGDVGLSVTGLVENVRAIGNGSAGMRVSGLAKNNVASRNGGAGIHVVTGSALGNATSFNGGHGIETTGPTLVASNFVASNDGDGIHAIDGTVSGNTCYTNTGAGISVAGASSVVGNTVSRNGTYGLDLGSEAGYANNVIAEPTASGGAVSGGVQTGGNLCDGVLCP